MKSYLLSDVVLRCLVLGEMIGPIERPLADVTFEFLTAIVQLHVLTQVVPSVEALRAYLAEMRLLFAMRGHMPF